MKSIAFIDNFIETPINHCVNEIILRNKILGTYHAPAKFGFQSLYELEHIDGIIILGSASNITTPEHWHKELIDFVIPHLEKQVPTLAICFGHQLMAHHFGCTIGFHSTQQEKFDGIRKVSFKQDLWRESFNNLFPMPYAHQQIVTTVSEQFDVIAQTDELAYEGLKHKTLPLWSLQGHPESSLKFLKEVLNLSDDQASSTKTEGNKLIDAFISSIKK